MVTLWRMIFLVGHACHSAIIGTKYDNLNTLEVAGAEDLSIHNGVLGHGQATCSLDNMLCTNEGTI